MLTCIFLATFKDTCSWRLQSNKHYNHMFEMLVTDECELIAASSVLCAEHFIFKKSTNWTKKSHKKRPDKTSRLKRNQLFVFCGFWAKKRKLLNRQGLDYHQPHSKPLHATGKKSCIEKKRKRTIESRFLKEMKNVRVQTTRITIKKTNCTEILMITHSSQW